MTWQINGYFLPLYDDEGPPELVMTTVLTEHLGVIVEFIGEDEWSVRTCAPWNVSCIHGLSKEDAFEAGHQVADEWRRLIRILLDRGRQTSFIYTPSDVLQEEVGSRGRSACNKVHDRILGTPFWPDVPEVDGSGYSTGGYSTGGPSVGHFGISDIANMSMAQYAAARERLLHSAKGKLVLDYTP